MTRTEGASVGEEDLRERKSWLARRKDRSERGDTMVEILLSLIVLGLTSVALLIGFSTTISASAQHRALASANLAINNYSQQITAGIEADSTLFTCPGTPYTPASFMTELAIASPAPYSPQITSIQYWNPTTESFGSTCVANSSELITVSVSSGSKNETLSFVVDSPTAGSNFVGGAPTNMAFVTPAAGSNISASSGASLPVNPVVEGYFGNSPDATDLSPISLSLGDANGNPTTAGTLSGCSSNDLNGIVTYLGCSISLTSSSGSGTIFTLVATTPSLAAPAVSGQITVTGSTSSYLSFTTQPSAGYSGAVMSTQPTIKAYLGGTTNVDTTVMSITLTTSGSVSGSPQLTSCSGTSGYSTTSESNGVVTVTDSSGHGGTFSVSGCHFSGQFYYDVNSGAVGTPYTMTASATGVMSATSQPFAATGYGSATQMEFVVEPSGGSASSTTATTATLNSFQIAIEDSWGNILSGQGQSPYSGSISVKVTGGSTLTCTPTSSGGIFTFSGCSAAIGANLSLTATATGTGSGGVAPAVSSNFNDTGPVTQLVWYDNYPSVGSSGQPVAGASGAVMTNQPVLAFEDAGKNPGETSPLVVTSDTTSVSYTSSYASGTQGTPLNGTLTTCSNLPPVNGIISAGNCTFVGLVGTNYTMSATTTSGPVITSPASATFSPTGPGPASKIVFTPSPGVEPVAAAAGSPFSTEPVAVIEDAGGNLVTSSTTQVQMNAYLTSNPTIQGGSLLNCSTQAPVNGSVSLVPVSGYLDVEGSCAFGGVLGTSYELIDTAPGLTSAVSTSFSPTTFGPPNAIVNAGCASGVNYKGTCVLSATVQDAWGNLVTSYVGGITFADVGGAGAVDGLGTFTASAGVASDTVTGSVVGPIQVTTAEGSVTSPPYGFNVIGDTTTATVTESPTSVVYGQESASVFSLTVVTGHHEILPSSDSVTVNVGSASCVAMITPGGSGGSGTCSIANTALAASTSPYTVTATYSGDAQLLASPQATAPTPLTVSKDTTTATVSESPTSVVFGNEGATTFTVNVVTGHHEALAATDNTTVNVGSASCVAAITPGGSGGSGTCSIANTALAASTTPYTVTATFPGDTDLAPSSIATATTGLTVTKDSTTIAVSAGASTVAYGNEGSSVFTVNVNPANGENLPAVENVTVNVGSTSCVAAVAVSTVGSCSIPATALPASTTPYTITATYSGDGDLTASALATAPTGLTVTKDTSTVSVTSSPSNVTYGNEGTSVFTVSVNPTYGENLSGVENVTVNVGSTSCVAAVAAVTRVGTCSIANTALSASATPYSVTAAYGGDANISASALATAPTGLTVNRAAPPTINWSNAAPITYGTALDSTQLYAIYEIACTLFYTPVPGTVLPVGTNQTLSVTFTTSDTTDYASATAFATITVTADSTTATVSESPSSVTYGNESASVFTVTVVTGHHEILPTTDNVTVNVGSANCIAHVAPAGNGGTGTCSLADNALPHSATAYGVSATYPGDADLAASSTATASTGLSVNMDSASATVSGSPSSVTYNAESLAVFSVAVVTGNHEVLPATENVTVNVGTASCVAAVAPSGSGGTGTCSISATALAPSATPYAISATYPGDSSIGASPLATAAIGLTVNKATQSALVLTTTSASYPGPLTLATSGGSGTGGLSFSATNGTASGCSVSGTTLSVTSPGTCLVTAIKAADTDYLSATTGAVTVTFANAAPTITSPTAASPEITSYNGYAIFNLTGTGFVSGSVVTGNGSAYVYSYSYISSTQIQVIVIGTGHYRASGSFTVTNPGGANVTSQSGSFING